MRRSVYGLGGFFIRQFGIFWGYTWLGRASAFPEIYFSRINVKIDFALEGGRWKKRPAQAVAAEFQALALQRVRMARPSRW
jgi:hypothetical protein